MTPGAQVSVGRGGKLLACVVGAGEMGRHHVRVLTEIAGVRLGAVVDADADRLAEVTRTRTVSGYGNVEEMVLEQSPDFAVVAVPTVHHEAVASELLRAGVNVLIEKPIAATVESANRIMQLAEERGLLVSVGHVERFNPAVLELRRRLVDGEIGRPFQVVARRTGPFPDRVKDLGVIRDLATHDLDIIRFVFGSPFEVVFAQTERQLHAEHEDLASILGRLADGTIAVLDVNWLTPKKTREIRVIGEGGMLAADYLRQELTVFRNGQSGEFGTLETFTSVSEGEVIQPTIERREPLRLELDAFVAALKEGKEAPVTVDDAIEALRTADRALTSASTAAPA